MEAKALSSLYFEDARQVPARRATSDPEKLSDLINSSDGKEHRITHPVCFDCGAYMILLHDGKFCPRCGRLAHASEYWIEAHPKYSGVLE